MPDSVFSGLRWQEENSSQVTLLSETVKDWLFWQGSLTVKLKQCCTKFEVKVRSEKWIKKTYQNETALLPQGQYWCREVILYGDDKPWVEARTLISPLLAERYQELLQLGTMPIGEWLFRQAPGRRTIQWSRDEETGLYARRSLFLIRQMPLLISELFLEDSPITK